MQNSCPNFLSPLTSHLTLALRRTVKNGAGFTLTELMVVIAIIGLIFVVGLTNYIQFNRRQIFDKAVQELKSNLRLAQDKALAGEKPAGWCNASGEHLKGYRLLFWYETVYTLYLIQAACSNGQFREVKSVYLPGGVSSTGGSVLFKVLGHGIEEAGPVSFTLTGYNQTKTITVTETGEIREE